MKNILFLLTGILSGFIVWFILKISFTADIYNTINSYSNLNDIEKLEFIELYRKKNGETVFYDLERIFNDSKDNEATMLIGYYLIETVAISDSLAFYKKYLPILESKPDRVIDSTAIPPIYLIVNDFCKQVKANYEIF